MWNYAVIKLPFSFPYPGGSLRLVGTWLDEISRKRISRFGGWQAKQKLELEKKLLSFFERYADTL